MPKLPGMVGLLKTYLKLFESYNTEAFEYIIIVQCTLNILTA